MKTKLRKSGDGLTLIELLIAILMGVIVMMSLVFPFAAERAYWRTGGRQVEAQRDAQFVLRYVERRLRQAVTCSVAGNVISFKTTAAGPTETFQRSTATLPPANRFLYNDGAGNTTTLIDAVRSSVSNFTVTKTVLASGSSMLTISLTITHQGERTEILQTMICLRNAP